LGPLDLLWLFLDLFGGDQLRKLGGCLVEGIFGSQDLFEGLLQKAF